MYKIMNRRYNISSSWENIYSLVPSGYIRKGTLQVFHKIRRNYPNDHIMCIGYIRGDTQFVLTETFKTYEDSVEQVIDRCLKEECSVERIKTESTIDSVSFVYNEKFATIHCVPYRVSLDNLRPSEPLTPEECEGINSDDDKTRKLVLLLHGPLHVLKKVFSKFYSSEDDISHITAIPVSQVSHIFPKLFPLSLYPNSYNKSPHQSFLSPPVKAVSH